MQYFEFSLNIFLIKFAKLKENLTIGTKESLYNNFMNMFSYKPHCELGSKKLKTRKPENDQYLHKTHLIKCLHCQFIVFQYLQYSINTEKFKKFFSLKNHASVVKFKCTKANHYHAM